MSESSTRHQGKAAFVTGAGSGIGRAIAIRLADEGAGVTCADVNGEGAKRTAAEIEARHPERAVAAAVDVRDRDQVQAALARTVDAFGGLQLLVNAAGKVTMTGFADLVDEEWDDLIDVNLKGYFVVAQEAAKELAKQGGAIVNISSVEDEVIVTSTGHCQPHYNASKGGVKALTKALAAELAADGIRVNSVAPGPVNTRITGLDIGAPEIFGHLSERLLIKRLGEPEDIAAAVSFLLSDDASFITGSRLAVDGGWEVR